MSLEIGTAETISDENKKLKNRAIFRGGESDGRKNRGGGGNNGGNKGGGGDVNPNNQKFPPCEEEFKPDKSRIVMWFLLVVVMMTFGALISAYVVISTNGVQEWRPVDLPLRVLGISTFLILVSSAVFQISYTKLKNNDQTAAKKWLLAAIILGGMFISSQILAWLELIQRGINVKGNPYTGFFYILTVVHAAHVFGGIAFFGYILLRTWRETILETELLRRKTFSKVAAWYWHFMGGLWIVLFLLLGLWK